MKLVIINEYAVFGGAEEVACRQRELLESAGHEVKFLCFSPGLISSEDDNSYYDVIPIPKLYKIFRSPIITSKIKKYLDEFNPDLVILHGIFSSPLSVFEAIRGRRCVQVIHDGYFLCPTGLGSYLDTWDECNLQKGLCCCRRCARFGLCKLILKMWLIDRVNHARREIVELYIAPSQWLANVMHSFAFASVCLSNCVNMPRELQGKSLGVVRRVLYAGGLRESKGLFDLCEALSLITDDFCLDVYGPKNSSEETERFMQFLERDQRISYLGNLKHDTLLEKMRAYDFLVLPSKWRENYPTLALEAFAAGVVVIGADRGGIPEIIGKGRGVLYESGNIVELAGALAYCMSDMRQVDYDGIRMRAFKYARLNNTPAVYIERLFKLIGVELGMCNGLADEYQGRLHI